MARPTKYRKEYCQEIIEFFTREPFQVVHNADGSPALDRSGSPVLMPCPLPTLEGFSIKIGVTSDTLLNWAKKHDEFLGAVKRAKDLQKEILVQNGLAGNYEKAFAIFLAKNVTNMKDYKALEVATSNATSDGLSTIEDKEKLTTDNLWQIEFIGAEKQEGDDKSD